MTRRPDRLKATKLYGSEQVADKLTPLVDNDNNTDTVKKTSIKLNPGKSATAGKKIPQLSNDKKETQPKGGKQLDSKKVENYRRQSHENDSNVKGELKKGLPKGFVTKEVMEQKNSKRIPLGAENDKKPMHNQTNTLADSKTTTNENASTKFPIGFVPKEKMEQKISNRKAPDAEKDKKSVHNQRNTLADCKPKTTTKEHASTKVPTGFVTREDMEARIKNRKTKQTKITPTYTQNNPHEQTNEKHKIPSVHKERDQENIDKIDPKPKHLFSKLEKRTQEEAIKNDEPVKDSQIHKQNKTGNKKGLKTVETPNDKKPLLANKKSDEATAVSKTNPIDNNKVKITPAIDAKGSDRMTSASTKKSSATITPRMTSTAIPKGQKNNAKLNHYSGVALKSVKILIMNANGKDDKGGTPAERRKNAIQNVVLKHTPNIVLFQEFSWVGITGKTWAKYPIPEHFVYKGHYDASIMYDSTCITVQDLPATEIDTILSGLQSNANNRLKRTFPMDFTPVARMSISRVTAPTKPGLDFICISWHGMNNGQGGGKMKELKKIEYFEYWMEFLRNIREKYKLPILAAGDYNVDMYSIEKCVQSPFKLCIYEASMRRTVKGIVDFCIVTDDLGFTDITWVNLERDTTVFHPNEILDHDPILGSLTVSAQAASSAALGKGKKSWPSPIAKHK